MDTQFTHTHADTDGHPNHTPIQESKSGYPCKYPLNTNLPTYTHPLTTCPLTHPCHKIHYQYIPTIYPVTFNTPPIPQPSRPSPLTPPRVPPHPPPYKSGTWEPRYHRREIPDWTTKEEEEEEEEVEVEEEVC
ncbi:hypothetical protein E2C01_093245 [Portunus trituberculatus]|uniref:Uncharacterized protein n=1 Tax=Portunus trituberculatus TaxID=210409 RepID=A0A5B7JP98_PORTR|nr:hypothetical protein [Portunus trituberculatus]